MNSELENQSVENGQSNYAQQNQSSLNQSTGSNGDNRKVSETDSQQYVTELKYRSAKNVATGKLARGLGWFSIALGAAEFLAPEQMGELIGVGKNNNTLRALGLREIASGIGILSQPKPAGWVWSRVGGDAMDLALLGKALMSDDTEKGRVAMATMAVLGVAALDYMCAQQLSEKWQAPEKNDITPTTVGQPSGRHTENIQ